MAALYLRHSCQDFWGHCLRLGKEEGDLLALPHEQATMQPELKMMTLLLPKTIMLRMHTS